MYLGSVEKLFMGTLNAVAEGYELVCTNPVTPHRGHAEGATKCWAILRYKPHPKDPNQAGEPVYCGYSLKTKKIGDK